MPKFRIAFEIELSDPTDIDAQVEDILHDIGEGMICYPLEKRCQYLISEPKLEALYRAKGWNDEQIWALRDATRRTYELSRSTLRSLWDSRKIDLNPV